MNQGFDVADATMAVICGLTSKALTMIQRVGRIIRYQEAWWQDKVSYVQDSQEEKWLKSSVRKLDNVTPVDLLIRYIFCKFIGCAVTNYVNLLIENGISADDFLALYAIYRKGFKTLDKLKLNPNWDDLQSKGYVKLGDSVEKTSYAKSL